jgi:hypothetical protein
VVLAVQFGQRAVGTSSRLGNASGRLIRDNETGVTEIVRLL